LQLILKKHSEPDTVVNTMARETKTAK